MMSTAQQFKFSNVFPLQGGQSLQIKPQQQQIQKSATLWLLEIQLHVVKMKLERQLLCNDNVNVFLSIFLFFFFHRL